MCSLYSEDGYLHTLVKLAICAAIVLMTPLIDVPIPQIRTSNDTTRILNTGYEILFETRDIIHVDPISSCACFHFGLYSHSPVLTLLVMHSFAGNGRQVYTPSFRTNVGKSVINYLLSCYMSMDLTEVHRTQ